jgi:hypothetical protein
MLNFVRMFKKYFVLFPALFLCRFLAAQDLPGAGYDNGTNLNVLYRNDMSGKLFATTRGYGVGFRKGKHITSKTRSFYDIELQTLKHPKEIKVPGEAETRRRYVYGKVNSVLLLRGAVGLQNVIFQKADHKAVEVRYSYSIGPVLAFAKPYYVQIYKSTPGSTKTVPATVKFDAESFSQDSGRVIGRGQFTDGLYETKFYPGLNAKFNLSFEYAPYTNLIRAIETGISLDYFPKALPIMAKNPSENFILTLHLGFVFGRKWF